MATKKKSAAKSSPKAEPQVWVVRDLRTGEELSRHDDHDEAAEVSAEIPGSCVRAGS